MRAIKFRAWLKNENRYINVNRIDFADGTLKDSIFGNEFYDFNDLVLEQFTGLHDKNGAEIYEGDNVLYTDNFKVNGTTSHVSSVEWVPEIGGFYIKVIGYGYCNLNKSQCEKYNYEVIGNIHERSEDNDK